MERGKRVPSFRLYSRIFPAIRGRTRKRDFDWPRSPVGIKRTIFDTRRPVFDRRLKKSKLSNWDVFFSFSLKFVREEISSSIFSRINFKSKRFLFFFFRHLRDFRRIVDFYSESSD